MATLDAWMQQVRPQALIAGAGALTAIVALAGFLYVLKPALQARGELQQERVAALSQVEEANITPQALAAAAREVADLRKQLVGASWGVPLEEMESFVIGGLDRISVRHEVELKSVTPGQLGSVLSFDELPYQVQVAGDYFSLFDWLQDVEQELIPMVTKGFEMARRGESVTLKLRLVAYKPRRAES